MPSFLAVAPSASLAQSTPNTTTRVSTTSSFESCVRDRAPSISKMVQLRGVRVQFSGTPALSAARRSVTVRVRRRCLGASGRVPHCAGAREDRLARMRVASASSSNPSPVASQSHDAPEEGTKIRWNLLRMARPQNLLPAFFLVLLGAWIGTGRSNTVISQPTVIVVSILSGAISAASMLINDYFDWASGVDGVNSPDKPLVSGKIQPNVVLLTSLYMYSAILAAACLMNSMSLRTVIATSAGLTILYTPILKSMTVVKNVVVAAIIAASPLAGALAAGAVGEKLSGVILTCIFAFLGVVYREIVMDINDVEGDRAAGVKTLPVMYGKHDAMLAASYSLLCATLVGCFVVFTGSGIFDMLVVDPAVVRYACCAALFGILMPIYASVIKMWVSDFDKHIVSEAIGQAMPHFAMGMLLLSIRV